jgi:hypothetical protein
MFTDQNIQKVTDTVRDYEKGTWLPQKRPNESNSNYAEFDAADLPHLSDEAKKERKRKQNRESAARSRMKKQLTVKLLKNEILRLRGINAVLI